MRRHPPRLRFSERTRGIRQSLRVAGLVWIGPTPEQFALFGDKAKARALAARCGVPLAPRGALGVNITLASGITCDSGCDDSRITLDRIGTASWPGLAGRRPRAKRRETKAFLRARAIATAVDLLRLILAYCLGERGLRSTAAWATAIGLADISNVALLQRLRRCGDWFALLVGEALAAAAPQASRGRLIRIIDATTVPKAGAAARGEQVVAHSAPSTFPPNASASSS